MSKDKVNIGASHNCISRSEDFRDIQFSFFVMREGCRNMYCKIYQILMEKIMGLNS